MYKALSVVNEKGGVGKTATAEALSDGLKRSGKQVLCIDLDPQANLTTAMHAQSAEKTVFDLLAGDQSAAECITHTDRAHIIAGSRSLATITPKPGTLTEALQGVSSVYDYIVIDCPPAMGSLSINALTASHGVIIPATADAYSLQALSNIRATVEAVKRNANPSLSVLGVLLTRYVARSIITRDFAEAIERAAQSLGTSAYKAKIRECTAIREAQATRQSIFDYAPRSNAAADYAAAVLETVQRSEAK